MTIAPRRLLSVILLIATTINVSGCAAVVVLGAATDVAVTGLKVSTGIVTSVAKSVIPKDRENKE